ncbi:MAG: hypothetical protein ABIR56_09885 [Polaromonas sp.]
MDAIAFETETGRRYGAVHALIPDTSLICVLHIGAEKTGVGVGDASVPRILPALAIGSEKTARAFFKHTPASPLELETAIETVEGEVMRARPLIPAGATLYTTDAAVREIAVLSGVGDAVPMQLSVEAMERTFDRLTSVAGGRPASHEGLPVSTTFAATLLILREFMHHLQFSSITVVDTPAPTS